MKQIKLLFIAIFFISGSFNLTYKVKVEQSNLSPVYIKHIEVDFYKHYCKAVLYNTNWTSGSRDSLGQYLRPIFEPIIEQHQHNYSLPFNELVAVVMTIATSESGNSKGQPFQSFLFKKHNNPFGIKGNGSGATKTVEYYDGIRTEIHDSFMHFKSLECAIEYLLNTFLMTDRYERVRNAKDYVEFFTMLGKSGYFTHPTWHEDYFIPTCRKYYM